MSYRQSYLSQGDPFLGGILGKGLKLVKGITGLGGGGVSKKELEAALKDRLAAGTGAVVGGAKTAAKFVAKHKGAAAGIAGLAAAAGMTVAEYRKAHGMRRSPHMQVTNTRALRRSMRRVQGFAKIAQRTMTFVKHHRLKKRRR